MPYDIITIGSAFKDVYLFSKKFRVLKNARMITGEMECFAFGTKIELDDVHFEIGGGAVNTAATFSNQGFKAGCLARIGQDSAGEDVKKYLRERGIGDLLVYDKKRRTAQSVVFLAPNGERTILVYRGAAHEYKTSDIPSAITKTKWLYVTSLAGKLDVLKKILRLATSRGVKVALNPGKLEVQARGRLAPLLKYVDVLNVNDEEASILAGMTPDDEKKYLSALRRMCPGIIVVTKGSRGSSVLLNDILYRGIIKPVKAVDTTGAGDAFGSGFVAGIIRFHGDIVKSLQLASNNAAGEVKQLGAKNGIVGRQGPWRNVQLSIVKNTFRY